MVIAARLTLKPIATVALCAGLLAGLAAAAQAADLGLQSEYGVKRVWTSRIGGKWHDRCAYAGYYCLYAEYGYVFAYPFDDRPVARARRRHLR